MNLKVGAKIGIGFVAMLILIVLLGVTTFTSVTNVQQNITILEEANNRMVRVLQIQKEFASAVLAIRGYIAYGDEKYYQQSEEKLNTVLRLEKDLYNKAEADKKPEVQKIIDNTTQYKEGIFNKLMPVIREQFKQSAAGNIDMANQLRAQGITIAKEFVQTVEQMTNILDTLAKSNDELLSDSLVSAQNNAKNTVNTSLVFSILSIIVGVSLSWLLTRMVRKPISLMLTTANTYASGDFSSTVEIESTDEFGQLGLALNTMQQNFKTVVGKIQGTTEQLAASSEELTASAEQHAQASGQVARAITEVAVGTDRQSSSVSETSAAIEQISSSIQQVASTSNTVANMTSETLKAASEGELAIQKVVGQMGNIGKSSEEVRENIDKLAEGSNQINEIVSMIAGIASQTNLLALNAAIEAARAGEQGRGFAVVAEEVRKLAEQSHEATKQIGILITDNQVNIDTAVKSMAIGAKDVRDGIEVVEVAGVAFERIGKLIDQVSGHVQAISATIQQMAGGSQQIVASIREVDTISRNNSGEAQTVSAATQEQAASVEQIASASQSLARMAQELQEVISVFRV